MMNKQLADKLKELALRLIEIENSLTRLIEELGEGELYEAYEYIMDETEGMCWIIDDLTDAKKKVEEALDTVAGYYFKLIENKES